MLRITVQHEDHQLLLKLEANTTGAYAFHLTRCDRVVNAVLGRLAQLTPTWKA